MSDLEEENEKIVRRLLEARNKTRDMEVIQELIHDDYNVWEGQVPLSAIDQKIINPEGYRPFKPGKEGFIERTNYDFAAYTHKSFEIREVMTKGDKVWVWYHIEVKQTGPFFDIPPTDKILEFDLMQIFQLRDGQIIRSGSVRNGSTLFQLGKIVIAENDEENVTKYVQQLRKLGLLN